MKHLTDKLERLYAAIGETITPDLKDVATRVTEAEPGVLFSVDFRTAVSHARAMNMVHGAISNVANIKDHLKRWARANGREPRDVEATVSSARPLQIILDLANTEKHGPDQRKKGHSGLLPRLTDVGSVMRGSLKAGDGPAFAGLRVGPAGLEGWTIGPAETALVVTGTIVDGDGKVLGDLLDCLDQATTAWERLFTEFGIPLPAQGGETR